MNDPHVPKECGMVEYVPNYPYDPDSQYDPNYPYDPVEDGYSYNMPFEDNMNKTIQINNAFLFKITTKELPETISQCKLVEKICVPNPIKSTPTTSR